MIKNLSIFSRFNSIYQSGNVLLTKISVKVDLESNIKRALSTMPSRHINPPSLRPLVLCGPSGSGKSTLVKRLLDDFPNNFGFTVSHTTRLPRSGEINGKHYHFVDEDTMKKAIDDGRFIEHAIFSGNYYGTSYEAVEVIVKQGKIVIMDIDVQGVRQVKKSHLDPWYVFIKPPSLEELRQRLIKRKTETEDSLNRRLSKAAEEIKYGVTPGNFDLIVINDDLDKAYRDFKDFVSDKVLVLQNVQNKL